MTEPLTIHRDKAVIPYWVAKATLFDMEFVGTADTEFEALHQLAEELRRVINDLEDARGNIAEKMKEIRERETSTAVSEFFGLNTEGRK